MIGIAVLCTNAYFVLGIRFIRRFMKYYKGDWEVMFYIFSDRDPSEYLPEGISYKWIKTENSSWVDGTNLKFKSILSLYNEPLQYIYYFDADTNVSKDFTEDWFLGDLVGGQHYNDTWPQQKPYDRNPKSKAYIPYDTEFPQTYCYGAFFGGKKSKVLGFCQTLLEWQQSDREIGYEPAVNDESYINKYFHYSPSKVVMTKDFAFDISDKGGIGETRNMNLNIDSLLDEMRLAKDMNYNIRGGELIYE